MVYNIISIRRSVQKLSYCAIMDFWLAAPFWGWDAGQIVAPWAMVICIEASEKHNKRNCEPANIECRQIYYELLPHENLIMHYQKWRAEETSIHQSINLWKHANIDKIHAMGHQSLFVGSHMLQPVNCRLIVSPRFEKWDHAKAGV